MDEGEETPPPPPAYTAEIEAAVAASMANRTPPPLPPPPPRPAQSTPPPLPTHMRANDAASSSAATTPPPLPPSLVTVAPVASVPPPLPPTSASAAPAQTQPSSTPPPLPTTKLTTPTTTSNATRAVSPVPPALPNGSAASPPAVPLVKKAPVPLTSGNYQSLSAAFGDDDVGSVNLGSGKFPSRKELSGPSSVVSGSSSSTAATVGTPRLTRSGSIDRLTGRVPLPAVNGTPLKVGWLKREGDGLLGGFKKRWCALNAKTFDIFKEITDEKSQTSIVIPGASIFLDDKTDFHILPIRGGKKVSFRCDTEFERNAWVKLLSEVAHVEESLLEKVFDADSYVDWSGSDISNILLPSLTRLLAKVGTMSSIWGVGDPSSVGVLLSGHLTKMGEKVKNFKRRYFVLVGSILLYFESEESYMLTDAGGALVAAPPPGSTTGGSAASAKVEPVLGRGAPTAPAISTSSKGSHGKEVLASLARTHQRTQRRSITAFDLQNHHLIRRSSQQVGSGSGSGGPPSAADEEKRKQGLQKKVLKGDAKHALGFIPLRDCTLALEPSHQRPHGFSIQTRDRKYFLYADNDDELRGWFYMCNLIVHSLPIQKYMKRVLDEEFTKNPQSLQPGRPTMTTSSSSSTTSTSETMTFLHDDDLTLLKKQLSVTLLDPTCLRYFQNYWLERQSFHEPRTYPYLFPLDSPLTMLTEDGSKFFLNMLDDEAGERGENAISIPVHYLHFWLDCENWMNLDPPTKLVDGGDESNPFATAQDPSCIETCIPLAQSYRQQRAEEIIDKYLSHGAPYHVHLDRAIVDEIFSSCLRGRNAPNKIAPPQTLFQKAQDMLTELIAIEVFPRYLKSKSSHWSYLASIAGKYDETLILGRAEVLVEPLMLRAYEPDVYVQLSQEEKDEEEDDRLQRFTNLNSSSPDAIDALALECAEQFRQLPNTDPTKMIYHNYLYALQRLQEYHALFSIGASTPSSNQPPVELTFRQTFAANAFFHEFLTAGAPYALCIPHELVRGLRPFLFEPSPRREYLFMDVEHVLLTELQFALDEARLKVTRQLENKTAQKAAAAAADRKTVARTRSASRLSIVPGGPLPPLPSVSESPPPPTTQSETNNGQEPAAAPSTVPMQMLVDTDVPFNMVFGISSLFAHFRRFTLTCRHINPQYLWDQVTLVSKIFDYRRISDPKLLTSCCRQIYSQYLSENAPNKINFSKTFTDPLKVGISQTSPGPHIFLNILKELYKSLEHIYVNSYRTLEVNQVSYAYLQEDFGLFLLNEICLTQGKRDFNFDANVKNLMTQNKNASTWFDILEFQTSSKELDESLQNLSSHQAIWCAYFKQFLTERFCAENAAFYVEADDYRHCPGPSYRVLRAKRLYDRYISDTASLQVNVPSSMARELTTILQRDGVGAAAITANPASSQSRATSLAARPSSAAPNGERVDLTASSPLLFIAAQREIFLLILNDSMKPFLDSQPFKTYRSTVCQAKV